MQITGMELKQSTSGKAYKAYTLSEKVQGKDRFSLFPDHPMYETLNVGSEVSAEGFYLNKNGYLAMTDPSKFGAKKVTKTDVDLGFVNNRLKEIDNLLLRIGEKQGVLTPAEKLRLAQSIDPKPVTFEPNEEINPEDIPF